MYFQARNEMIFPLIISIWWGLGVSLRVRLICPYPMQR